MEVKFYKCRHCGNIVSVVKASGAPISCCGEIMAELKPGAVEAAHEKHIPQYKKEGNVVNVVVGELEHPMLDVHYIEWICLQTKRGSQIKYLRPGEAPKASFALAEGDEFEAVYAYCNLHGLWKK